MLEQETLKRPEISPFIQPQFDPGGRLQPVSWLNDIRVIARPIDRILPVKEAQEIPIAPGLGRNSQLKDTDWNSELEINTLFKNYNRYIREGKTPQEALQGSFSTVEQDIRTFTLEFIQAKLIIPFLVSLDPSSQYSILSKYDNRPVVLQTSSQERLGANLDAAKAIDAFMKTAPKGSVAIVNSPPGETGWFDRQGKPIIYTDNQMTVYIKGEDGSFRAFTIVSDLNYDQSRQYSIGLGVNEQSLGGVSEMEKLANIVRNPITLSFREKDQSPVDCVVDKLLSIRGTGKIRIQKKDGNFEFKPVSELMEGIARREDMLLFCEEAEQVISQLRKYFFAQVNNLGNFDIQKEASEIVDKAILEITRINRPKSSKTEIKKTSSSSTSYFRSTSQPSYAPVVSEWMQRDYRPEIAYLENQKGCAGGSRVGTFSIGSSTVISFGGVSSSGARLFGRASTSLESDSKGSLYFNCPFCDGENKRPYGGYVYFCQHCKKEMPKC